VKICYTNNQRVHIDRDKDMGLPTRLHGIAVANFFGAVVDFCPRCIGFKKWKVIRVGDKFYKQCLNCELKKEIKEIEFQKLVAKAKARREKEAQEKAKKKAAKK